MSLRQIAMVAKFLNLSKPWFYKYGGKNEKLTCVSFVFMTALTGKKTVANALPMQRPSLSRKILEIQKSCYHDNLTSNFSSLN